MALWSIKQFTTTLPRGLLVALVSLRIPFFGALSVLISSGLPGSLNPVQRAHALLVVCSSHAKYHFYDARSSGAAAYC